MTHLQPSIHVVKDTPVAKLFRRRLNCPDIITFFSVVTGQWILAYWMDKRIRVVDEVEDLGANFELVTQELVKQIAVCWGPVNWKAKKQRLLSRYRDQQRNETDTVIENQERYDWLKRRMKNPIPYAFQVPVAPAQG